MMARGTVTNKLTDVIQMLQMARKTGTLQVNRDGENKTIEQGAIYLQHGQIIDASHGSYQGAEALRRLQSWQSCYFVFQAHTQQSSGSLPSIQMSPTRQNPVTGGYSSGPIPTPATGYSSGQLANQSSQGGGENAPQRMREINEILPHFDRLGLTRIHRQLFLLVDGHRTLPELIRLMGRRTDEVDTLLNDLARTGLVRK